MTTIMTRTIEKPEPKDKYPHYTAKSVHSTKLCNTTLMVCTCKCDVCTEQNQR